MRNNSNIFARAYETHKQFDTPVLYADLKCGRNVNSEDELQIACLNWFNAVFQGNNQRKIHHSPNGGSRNVIEAAKFKRMGVRPGFPDLWVSLGQGRTGYIELKFGKNGLTDKQKEYRDFLLSEGHQWALCRTVDEFIATLKQWGVYHSKGGLNE